MAMNRKTQPSNLEMTILSLLWDQGAMSVRQVMSALPDGKARAYTSVLSVLQVMEKKGFVKHRSEGNTHFYDAKAPRERIMRPMLRDLVRNLFGGSPAAAVQNLLQATDANEDDLREMTRLINRYKKNENKGR